MRKNILHEFELAPRIVTPQHIELGLMKHFVENLPEDNDCYNQFLSEKFPIINETEIFMEIDLPIKLGMKTLE